jgi:hypothetical protein
VYDGLGNTMFWYAPERFDAEIASFTREVRK